MFRTNIHALLDEIIGEGDASDVDFESIDIREVLAAMLEDGSGSIGEIDYRGMAEHTAGDAEWLRTEQGSPVLVHSGKSDKGVEIPMSLSDLPA